MWRYTIECYINAKEFPAGDKGKEAKAEAVSRVRFTIAAMLPQDIRDPKVISAPNQGGDFVA